MNKDAFGSFHPLVNMVYFAAVIGFSMFFMHPINLGISVVCAFTYAIYLSGKKALRVGLVFMLPMLVLTAVLNPLFNHQGATILAYLPNGNPLTLESATYGIAAAVMLITVIAWFACFNVVMTSDKFVYLLGRIIPALSLILSMALRFVPRFRRQIKIVANAQKCIGRDGGTGSIFKRARNGIKIMSIVVTWALENAIETADSMKARGYGLPKRTAFSIHRFDIRDGVALAFIAICVAAIIAGAVLEVYRFRYFPTIAHMERGWWRGWTAALFAAHLALCAMPIIINIREDILWKRIKSKI
ncbi:MAG: energy-coupling factor transporter transmembrane protein EcfT [Defluviitaleaceae bacterium]|nr:energy-coupling factor transporter transmembrane protein EcfT [Defluviitaleaceae bacterium]